LLLFAAGGRAQEITERELVQKFFTASPHVRELNAGIAATRAETSGWSLWPNPSAGYTREGAGLTEFLQYEQPLAISGRLGHLRRAGSAVVGAAESQAVFTRWELISDLRSAFNALLTAQEREAAVRENLERLDEVIGILRAREKEGEGSAYDRLRAERERSEVETEITAVHIGTVEARSRLGAFFPRGSIPAAPIARGALAGEAPIPSAPELLARALAERGDYRGEAQQIESLDLRRRAAERLRIPEPSLIGGFKRADIGSRIANGGVVAISVPLPIFNRGQTEVARFRAESERAQLRRQAIEQRIEAEVEAARRTLELRRAVLADYKGRVQEQGRRLEEIARTAYQEGEIGILELLDAYRMNLQARLRSLAFLSAAKQAEIELERVIGAPVLNQEVLP
jgi:cobalt-zinc-cadmium efflux system outer membrane protein